MKKIKRVSKIGMSEELTRKALLDLGYTKKKIDAEIALEIQRRKIRIENKKEYEMRELLNTMVL